MMKRPSKSRVLATVLLAPILVAALVFGVLTIASAQEEGERSRFVRFVERQISTPDRQIRLGRIEGALSSDVRLSSITIADRVGVWLTIENARLVWSRTALIRRRLSIELLEAESITVSRPPLPAEGESEPFEPGGFEVPELPVSVRIDRLSVPRVDIAEGVIGPAAALGVDGSLSLIDGDLDTDMTPTTPRSP
jgi:translocation and assembly module TamB